MRKVDKTKILSTVYKEWEEQLEQNKENHDEYSSSHRYYIDVVMNLFHAQNGLCAYTEQVLCEENYYAKNNWKSGRYKGKKVAFGELEHFDPTKKIKQGWLWDNFLMIDSQVNRLKGSKSVSYLLKPDSPQYEPFELLAYDVEEHIFIANPMNSKLSLSERQTINVMLREVFQINHPTIIQKRKDQLTVVLEQYELFNEIKNPPKAFPTALRMCMQEMK